MLTEHSAQIVRQALVVIPLLLVIGFYCLIVTHNLIRAIIALELLTKAVTLLIIIAGWLSGRMALAQSLVITLIVVEVVVIAIAAGVVINIFDHNKSLDTRKIRELKG